MGDEVTPPGNTPLIEGLGPEWNDFVSAFPEDQRTELGSKLKERVSSYSELDAWRDFQKSGITPEQASSALNLYSIVENNPRQVYDIIGKSLGISAAEAKEVVEEIEEEGEDDPRFAELQSLKQQVETMSQIMLTRHQQEQKQTAEAQAEQELNKEMEAAKKKYGEDFDEEQVIMRMMQKGMTVDQAFADHQAYVEKVRSRRPAPMILSGSGGNNIPSKAIDPTKLDGKARRSLVAQMLAQGIAAEKQ